ncbi:MAG: DUF84 family protein [Bacteroidetes bacterium]|nr:DUF84 family protein [Bacteroidota bacterium]
MLILIASTRTPKIDGVRRAFTKVASTFGLDPATFEFRSVAAESGVAETPMSEAETMRGARQRAEQVFVPDPNRRTVSVGVEGGLFIEEGRMFLQSWSCLFDGRRAYFGSSGALELPSALQRMVREEGLSLGSAIDRFMDANDIRSRQGTYGALTEDIVTREDSFAAATTFALMPYLNAARYEER